MATGDLCTKFRADRSSGSRKMLADRHTDRRVDRNTPHPYRVGVTLSRFSAHGKTGKFIHSFN